MRSKSHLLSPTDSKPSIIITLPGFFWGGGLWVLVGCFFALSGAGEGSGDQRLGHLVLSGASKWAPELCMRMLLPHPHSPWPVMRGYRGLLRPEMWDVWQGLAISSSRLCTTHSCQREWHPTHRATCGNQSPTVKALSQHFTELREYELAKFPKHGFQ